MNDRLLTTPECAKRLSLSLSTIYALVHQGRIPHVKIGRALRFDPERIREWVEEQTREPQNMVD